MLEIEIDGKTIQVEDGSTIMDAALQVGSYIPHFCYHKKLSIAASCRMCLVEVEKVPKPLPACATPVTNGMKVKTRSANTQKAQKGVMEFLLINHPLDCPICDQGGECQLQDLAVGYGADVSRYREEKRVVFNKDLGPLISTDMTRCINCTRCVRFTAEIGGLMELGQAFRGEHAEIMPFIQKTVDSELSGNIIDLCPVGALTSKPFRYSARTWELSRRRSISPHDGVGANLIVQTKHDQVMRVLPYENPLVNECWLSDKDRFSYPALSSPDRLLSPEIKENGQWRKVDWQTALERAAHGLSNSLQTKGPSGIGALLSPHATLEELHLGQAVFRALGSDNIDARLRQQDFRADGIVEGLPTLGMSFNELSALDRLLIVGSFLRQEAPLLAQRVRQASKKQLKVSAIHVANDDWRLPVHAHALARPSELPGMLAQVLKAAANITGRKVEGISLEDVKVTEVAEKIAQSLSQGETTAIWLGVFAQQSAYYAELLSLAQALSDVTGAKLGLIAEAANTLGAYQAGARPLAGGMNAGQMLSESLDAYMLLNIEPSLDTAYGAQAVKTLAAAKFVISFSVFDSPEIREIADVLLPIAPFTETAGTYVNMEGRLQSFTAVAKGQGESRPAWKVLRVLGNILNLPGFEFESAEKVLEAVPSQLAEPFRVKAVAYVHHQGTVGEKLERVADVPLYSADSLVRRAGALQKTTSSKTAHLAFATQATWRAHSISSEGVRVCVQENAETIELIAAFDETLAPGCVRIAAALTSTASLGISSSNLIVEPV